jgi:hypothetical protein
VGKSISLSKAATLTIKSGIATALIAAAIVLSPRAAQAVPAFAQQTGQPCGQCHTGFPELTPFGRTFKLNGYTQRGGDENALKLSAMAILGYTRTQAPQVPPPAGFNPNDNFSLEQFSVFFAGAITDNLGAFVQVTYDGIGKAWAWDNVDIRYVNKTQLFGNELVLGVTVHNSPTVQDVWNTTPVWGHPYLGPALAPTPAAATIIEGAFAQQVGGAGIYVWYNNQFYFEVSGYKTLSQGTLQALGVNPFDAPGSISGIAPYARIAWERRWENHSLMVGAFGMIANVAPGWMPGIGTDRYTDLGLDAQYQYLGDNGYLTLRASYIHEIQNLDSTFLTGGSLNPVNTLDSFKASATVIFNKEANRIGFTVGYFDIAGSDDLTLYAGNASGFSPNSNGWMAEIFYIPFGMNKSPGYPFFNARIGLQYYYYNKFDGTTFNAQDNNAVFLYLWVAG